MNAVVDKTVARLPRSCRGDGDSIMFVEISSYGGPFRCDSDGYLFRRWCII